MRNRFVGDFTEPPELLCSFGPETIATAAIGTSALPAGTSFAAFAAPALTSTTTLASAATAGGALAGIGAAAKAAAPYLSAAGTFVNVLGQVQAGKSARAQGAAMQRASEYEAEQMRAKAGQERALAQRKAINDRRQTALAQSRLQALSAASGAGAGGPGVIDLAEDLEAEGELRALSSLYEGEERARGLETGAGVREAEGAGAALAGRIRQRGHYVGAGGSLLEGGARSLYMKYGSR